MPYLVAYAVPIIVMLLSVPMVLGKVPPNGVYGFRTPKTLSSPEIWYPANKASGWFMIGAGVLSVIVNSVLLLVYESPNRTLFNTLTAVTLVPLLLSLIASLVYLRRL